VVCHCLAIETDDGLVLVDTGFGMEDARNPRQLGLGFRLLMEPRPTEETTALKQIEALGFEAGDVKHIVVTHLDLDHAGGLPDFPEAEVHVFAPELAAALNPTPRERLRYIGGAHWKHNPHWVEHGIGGDEWYGFESVRILPGLDAEVLLVPLVGHSRGHTGIAVRNGILLVNHYAHLAQEGKPTDVAILQGSLERLVPILMTALCAALGLVPLAMALGEPGSELLAPLAVVVLGGLVSSTLLNLVVVPAGYSLIAGVRRLARKGENP